MLGTFGKADGLYTAGSAAYPQLVDLLSEMIPLAARRGGGLTWEYYFKFDGGIPPWTSAMSQGTGLEALTRGYLATGDASYLQIAEQALPIFSTAPKVGVRERTPLGARYLQYSFAPGTDIINAFLQSLIGLYDYAQASGSTRAKQLFAAGDAQAQAELPRFDTGAWSLYQPGRGGLLSYHELVTGFLDQLCTRTAAPVYCDDRRALPRLPDDAADAAAAHRAPEGASKRHDPLPPVEGLPRGDRAGPGHQDGVRDQRRLLIRRARVRDPRAQAPRDLHRSPRRHRPRRQLRPHRRDAPGFIDSRR